MRYSSLPFICALLAGSAFAAYAERIAVSSDEAKAWIRYTVPLPRSIEIPAKVIIPKSQVVIVPAMDSEPVIAQACMEISETIGLPEQPIVSKAAFKITMQLRGPEAEKLKALKNSDQAYGITPEAGETGLRLVALKPLGLRYAAKTLEQLIKPRVGESSVEIPLLSVTDWPDMGDRGLWGAETFGPLNWLGDRKINHLEQTSVRSVSADGRGHGGIAPGWQHIIDEGPSFGVESVPISAHLEQAANTGIFSVYPDLRSKGGKEGCICYSQPQIVDVLTDWIADLASRPKVAGVDVWMSENLAGEGGCRCAKCSKANRSVLEIRVVLSAWRKAQERLGRKIQLYVLSSEETYPDNELVLAELPSEVRFWYYHWLTYNTGRWQMIPACVAKAAKQGKWIGVVPSLDSMTAFTEAGVHGVLRCKAGDRGPREVGGMGRAGGTGRVARLRVRWPSGAQRGTPDPVATMLLEGKLPKLGAVLWDVYRIPFGDIKTVAQLDGDVAAAARALEMAKEMRVPEYWYESLVADGYIKSLKALYELGRLVKGGKVELSDRDAAERWFRVYLDGLKQASDALPKWEETRDLRHEHANYTGTPVKVIDTLRKQMAETAGKLGFDLKL